MTATLTERAQSFGHLFVDRVEKTPSGEAFRYRVGDEWKSLSWLQTKERVFNLAAGLVDLGLEPQQRVAIASTTRMDPVRSGHPLRGWCHHDGVPDHRRR
jgi:long-chain acyl-CoA synthetase